ncbi:MAG: hypothetical protein LBI95_02380, partial [Holosporales bacterium]|nr:hypothetical protein [Holosporales bacterium]
MSVRPKRKMTLPQISKIPLDKFPFCDFWQGADNVVFVVNDSSFAEYVHSLLEKNQKNFELIYLNFFDSEIYESTLVDQSIFLKRAIELTRILNSPRKVIVTTVAAINYKIPEKSYFQDIFSLNLLNELSIKSLANKLIDFGYTKVEIVKNLGEFAVRGGLVDLFIPTYENPIRIDFIGDKIDSIRNFDQE